MIQRRTFFVGFSFVVSNSECEFLASQVWLIVPFKVYWPPEIFERNCVRIHICLEGFLLHQFLHIEVVVWDHVVPSYELPELQHQLCFFCRDLVPQFFQCVLKLLELFCLRRYLGFNWTAGNSVGTKAALSGVP